MTQITEVSARHGHRKWVYGPLDPGRPIEIKSMSELICYSNWGEVDRMFHDWLSPQIAGFRAVLVPGMVSAALINVERNREITAAEYRARGIH